MAGRENEFGQTGRTVAENIKRLRGSTGYAELSRWLEGHGRPIPPLGLRRIEAGERKVDVDELMAFAFVFGVNANALLLPKDDRPEVRYEPTGAKQPQSLHRIWDWADGLKPYLLDTDEAHVRFSLDARPPGRDSVDSVRTSLEAVAGFQSQVEELQRTVNELVSERRRVGSDGDD